MTQKYLTKNAKNPTQEDLQDGYGIAAQPYLEWHAAYALCLTVTASNANTQPFVSAFGVFPALARSMLLLTV